MNKINSFYSKKYKRPLTTSSKRKYKFSSIDRKNKSVKNNLYSKDIKLNLEEIPFFALSFKNS